MQSLKKITKIGIIIAVASFAIAAAIFTLSPLFSSKTVNEPLPALNSEITENMEFNKFMNLTDDERTQIAKNMTLEQIDNIMVTAAKYSSRITEDMSVDLKNLNNTLTGNFTDAGDRFHHLSGTGKIFTLSD
jgi:hypothetical protein